MKAYKATVEVLIDPRVIGPDADTRSGKDGWNTPAAAADWFSALLSDNPDILDWQYERGKDDPTYSVIEIDLDNYEEGDMGFLPVIERVDP